MNLKLMNYYLRFGERTSRTILATDITLDGVRAMKTHREWEEGHKDVDPPDFSAKDWPRMIEAVEEWLRGCLGVMKIPLAYVIRPEEAVKPEAEDPRILYTSIEKELISRAPILLPNGHYTQDFLSDSELVWNKILALTREHDCWSHVRPAQRNTDGRQAFLGLKGHFLGANNVDNMAAEAESRLTTTHYHGEQRRWNFERYVKSHVDQHHILDGLHEHGYAGIDARSKVRHLMDGIKTNAFEAVKTRILSEPTLRSDFDSCVNLFKDYIKQKGAGSNIQDRDAKISAERTTQARGDDASPDQSVEDRYYSRQEYSKLSNAAKEGLRLKRKKRGHQPGDSTPKNVAKKQKVGKKPAMKAAKDWSKREIMALAKKVRFMDLEDHSSDSEQSEEKEAPKKPSNRNNKALQRKK